jgi:acyl-CoA synthetase (AMP-forming)/AMP-acid ligase II
VAVVGVPSERWGEEIAVAVRAGFDAAVEVEEMRAFLLERLARHKVPKLWKVVTEFPRTPMGKIQKFEVAKWFA